MCSKLTYELNEMTAKISYINIDCCHTENYQPPIICSTEKLRLPISCTTEQDTPTTSCFPENQLPISCTTEQSLLSGVTENHQHILDEQRPVTRRAPVAAAVTAVRKPNTIQECRQILLDTYAMNAKLKRRQLCVCCQSRPLSQSALTFLPCGHVIMCEDCGKKYDNCPACSKVIYGDVRTFLS